MKTTANALTAARHIELLEEANPHVPPCICRCKIWSELYGCGWPDAVQRRVDALTDPRVRHAVADLTAAMAASAWHKDDRDGQGA